MWIKLLCGGKDEPELTSYLFVFRSVSASYEATMNLKGIEVYRYSLLPTTLASPVDNPDNKCFCRNYETTKNCTLAGALDISSCSDGQSAYSISWFNWKFMHPKVIRIYQSAQQLLIHSVFVILTGRPIFISLPHFLQGSEYLREVVLGLHPDEEHHKTFLDVEPVWTNVILFYVFLHFRNNKSL